MDELPELDEPANLRFLRILVTILTGTMIAGLLVLILLIVTRYSGPDPAKIVTLPDQITLPEGKKAAAYTQGDGWFAIVTTDDTILFYDRTSAALIKTMTVRD